MTGKHWLSEKNLSDSEDEESFQVSPETAAAWQAIENSDKKRAREESREFMRKVDVFSNPVKKITTQWRILPEWRNKIVKAMLSDANSEIGVRITPPAKFPKDTRGYFKYLLKLTFNHIYRQFCLD